MAEVAQPTPAARARPALLEHAWPAGLAPAEPQVHDGAEGERQTLGPGIGEQLRVREEKAVAAAFDEGLLAGLAFACRMLQPELVDVELLRGELRGPHKHLRGLLLVRRRLGLRLEERPVADVPGAFGVVEVAGGGLVESGLERCRVALHEPHAPAADRAGRFCRRAGRGGVLAWNPLRLSGLQRVRVRSPRQTRRSARCNLTAVKEEDVPTDARLVLAILQERRQDVHS
mmetsp:Transcript_5123/g.14630  ORF Transcript_5123/g.14630 Transcript_5123/m.14630 type:complete len:230 (+) Transcript_5123:751-1440(+)